MSALVYGKVFYLDVPPYQKLTLLALADHAHDDGTKAYPTVARLIVKTGLSRASVFRQLADAVDAGIVEKVGRRGRGPVEYRFDMFVLDAAEQARRPSKTSHSETSHCETSEIERSHTETPDVSELETSDVSLLRPLTVIEPSDNPPARERVQLPEERLVRAWFDLEGRKATRPVLKKAVPIVRDFFAQWPAARSDDAWSPFLSWARANGVKMLGGLAVRWPQYVEAKPSPEQLSSKAWANAIPDCVDCLLSGLVIEAEEMVRCSHPDVEGGPFETPPLVAVAR